MLGATATTSSSSSSAESLLRLENMQLALSYSDEQLVSRRASSPPSSTSTTRSVAAPAFIPDACLFCRHVATSSSPNYSHMQTQHGLCIPRKEHLIVDLETLFTYLHVVVQEYSECLYCHTQQRSPDAVQQHMVDKGHCKFSIENGSEFRDFYDFTSIEEEEGSDSQTEEQSESWMKLEQALQPWQPRSPEPARASIQDSETLRLPSGKIVSRRSAGLSSPSRSQHRRRTPSPSISIQAKDNDRTATKSPELQIGNETSSSSPLPLTKHEKRYQSFVAQLSNLRTSDRQALAHLPVAEQQALLATVQKQHEQVERAEKKFGGKMDGLGNKKVMERFVNDVPGGRSHRNRFLAQ
ncbi:C2H2 type zinc-finger-domain-containing protein [Xylariales sp. AK1849]|nr:C2H2 type zinc-finger-domain-containing protein [Xylariales sp. AK1849]